MTAARASALAVCALSGCTDPVVPSACEDNLTDVTQLVMVMTETMDSAEATVAILQRSAATPQTKWTLTGTPYPAVVGRAGLGWGHGFDGLQGKREVVKREGDERTPAGLYRVGATFGYESAPWPAHITLKGNTYVCVDDVASEHYGKIVPREVVGAETSAEDMAAIPVYERGIVVDYPPNAIKKSGSCIFFHIWAGPKSGTAGCIASERARIADLQNKTASAKTAVVIWAKSAKDRLEQCLPGLPKTLYKMHGNQQHTQDAP